MKNRIYKTLFVGLLMATPVSSAFAQGTQGTVTFSTFNGGNSALGRVFLPDGVTGPGPNYVGQLYWSDTTNGTFVAAGTPQQFDNLTPTTIQDGSVAISGHDPGISVFVKLYVWNAAAGNSYEAALGSPSLIAYGISEAQSRILGGINSDGDSFGPQKFQYFPNFVLTARPALSSTWTGSDLILSWSGPIVLQSSTNLTGDFSDVSGANSPYTNSTTSSAQQFFRLRN